MIFKNFFQPGHSYSNPPGYYILGKIPSNTSFQDKYSFYIDEKKFLLKNKVSLLNLGEFSTLSPFILTPPNLPFIRHQRVIVFICKKIIISTKYIITSLISYPAI